MGACNEFLTARSVSKEGNIMRLNQERGWGGDGCADTNMGGRFSFLLLLRIDCVHVMCVVRWMHKGFGLVWFGLV